MRTLPAAAAALCLFVLVFRVLVLRVRRVRALVDALLELVDRASEGARPLGQLAPAEQHEPDDENDDELLTPQSKHGRPPPREGIRVRREPDERYARGGARGARRSARTPAGGESCGSGHAGAGDGGTTAMPSNTSAGAWSHTSARSSSPPAPSSKPPTHVGPGTVAA